MYCIIYYGYGDKRYLAFQNTDTEIVYGYYLTDKETFVMNLGNNKNNHPTLFRSEDKAMQFIKQFVSKRTGFSTSEFSYEYMIIIIFQNATWIVGNAIRKIKANANT